MKLVDSRSGLEVLSHDECVQLLAEHEVGRLVVVVHGAPHIVPVNYVFDGDAVVFRSDAGTKLDAAEGHPVAFEIDGFDTAARTGWSVVVHGRASEITEWDHPAVTAARSRLAPTPWAGGEKRHWVRVEAETITGRRIS